MILKIDKQDRTKSLYKCDKCGKECKNKDSRGIYSTNDEGKVLKRFDLCLKCYESFKKYVEGENDKK